MQNLQISHAHWRYSPDKHLLIAKIQLSRIEFDGATEDLDAIVGCWTIEAVLEEPGMRVMLSYLEEFFANFQRIL